MLEIRLVDAAENPNITTGFTDYFPADGMQTTLTLHCVGAARIQACKEYFLADGRQLVVSSPKDGIFNFRPLSRGISAGAGRMVVEL